VVYSIGLVLLERVVRQHEQETTSPPPGDLP